jgi:hypothetical protein
MQAFCRLGSRPRIFDHVYSPGGFHSGVETHFVVGNKGNVRIKVNDLKTTPGAETPGVQVLPLTNA